MIQILIANSKNLSTTIWSFILIHLVNLLLFQIFMITFCHILILLNVNFTSILKILLIKCAQNLYILKTMLKTKMIYWILFYKFNLETIRLFQDMHRFNNFHCVLLLRYCLLNLFVNAFLIALLIQGIFKNEKALFVLAFVLSQVNGIFAIHLAAAYFAHALVKSNKILFHLSASKDKNSNFRAKLELAHALMSYHTNNPYGFTYSKYGIIKLNGFIKVFN